MNKILYRVQTKAHHSRLNKIRYRFGQSSVVKPLVSKTGVARDSGKASYVSFSSRTHFSGSMLPRRVAEPFATAGCAKDRDSALSEFRAAARGRNTGQTS